MRKLSRRAIEDKLSIYQSLLAAVQDSSRDKLLINGLIDRLGTCINHDKSTILYNKPKNRWETVTL